MEKQASKPCMHRLKACALCRISVRPPKSEKPLKKERRRYAAIPQISTRQQQMNRLSFPKTQTCDTLGLVLLFPSL